MDGLTFDAKDHKYYFKGARVPNVTGVLEELTRDYYRFVDPDILRRKAELGTAAHRACELYDQDNLDESTVDPLVAPYLEAWIEFKKATDFEVLENEQRVFYKRLKYAGTLDRVGRIYCRSVLCIVDLKCIENSAMHMGIQTAAYAAAYASTAYHKMERYTVHLHPDGTFTMFEYTDRMDFPIFHSLLNIHNWRRTHGYCKK